MEEFTTGRTNRTEVPKPQEAHRRSHGSQGTSGSVRVVSGKGRGLVGRGPNDLGSLGGRGRGSPLEEPGLQRRFWKPARGV